jgi:hypothetical protein
MLERGVGSGMNGHSLDAHLVTGALNAQGNFAAIRYENFVQHRFIYLLARNSSRISRPVV